MTLSHLTVSEVNGGLDGLLLGNHFKDRPNDAPKLSQILDIYYQGSGHKSRYTNCHAPFVFIIDHFRYELTSKLLHTISVCQLDTVTFL